MSAPMNRRALIRMGATVSGAALVAALPALPALAEANPDAELLALCREIEAIEASSGLSDEEMDAGIDRQTALIWRLETMQANTPAGLLAKLRILNLVGDLATESEYEFPQSIRRVFLSVLADAERLAGIEPVVRPAKKPRAELPPLTPVPVPEPDAPVYASKEEILNRYSYWLLHERERLAREMYPDLPEPWRYIPDDRAARAFHHPIGSNPSGRDRGLHGSPSGRAHVMLAVAGVFTGPDADFDPRTWKGGAP